MLKRLCFGALMLSCLGLALPAGAQDLPADCPERPEDPQQAKKLAGEWFAKGDKLVEQKQDGAALSAFGCSLRMIEHPATLFNAAQAARLSNQPETALKLYRRFLDLAPEDRLADEARARIADLEKAAEEEKAKKEKPEVAVIRPEAPPAAKVASKKPAQAAKPIDQGRTLEIAGYATLGIGGAAAVIGAVLQGLAYKASEPDAKNADSYSKYNDLKKERDGFQTGAIVGFVVGGAAVGAGVAMVVLGKGMKPKDGAKATVSVIPGPDGLWISGRF